MDASKWPPVDHVLDTSQRSQYPDIILLLLSDSLLMLPVGQIQLQTRAWRSPQLHPTQVKLLEAQNRVRKGVENGSGGTILFRLLCCWPHLEFSLLLHLFNNNINLFTAQLQDFSQSSADK